MKDSSTAISIINICPLCRRKLLSEKDAAKILMEFYRLLLTEENPEAVWKKLKSLLRKYGVNNVGFMDVGDDREMEEVLGCRGVIYPLCDHCAYLLRTSRDPEALYRVIEENILSIKLLGKNVKVKFKEG